MFYIRNTRFQEPKKVTGHQHTSRILCHRHRERLPNTTGDMIMESRLYARAIPCDRSFGEQLQNNHSDFTYIFPARDPILTAVILLLYANTHGLKITNFYL